MKFFSKKSKFTEEERFLVLERRVASLESLLLSWGIVTTPEGKTSYSPALKQFQKEL